MKSNTNSKSVIYQVLTLYRNVCENFSREEPNDIVLGPEMRTFIQPMESVLLYYTILYYTHLEVVGVMHDHQRSSLGHLQKFIFK